MAGPLMVLERDAVSDSPFDVTSAVSPGRFAPYGRMVFDPSRCVIVLPSVLTWTRSPLGPLL